MRDYGKVHTSFWTSDTIRSLSEDGRMLAFYLLTNPHGTIAGVFRLPDGYVCEDMQWTAERVSKGFTELFAKGFATRCNTTKWVVLHKHYEWNPLENPNQRKSAVKIANSIPAECGWKLEYMRVSADILGLEVAAESKPLPNPSETISQSVSGTGTGTVVKTPPQAPEGFDNFWNEYPNTHRKQAKGKCLEVWKKAKAEPDANVIVSHVARLKASPDWTKNNGEFIPAPLVYLNQKRWQGAESTAVKNNDYVGAI